MASEAAPWQPAPTGDYLHNHDPQGNALSGGSDSPQSMPQPYRMVGKHGQVYDTEPIADPFCGYMDAVPNAADPNTGNARGISPGPFAKG